MKRVNLIIFFLVLGLAAYAQKEAKPKAPQVEKAKTLLDKGDLKGAKDIIDYALIYEKTKDKSKTHYYSGLIYEEIYFKQDSGRMEELDPNAFVKSINGYQKVKTIENEMGMYYIFSDQRLNKLYTYVFNKAALQYQNEDYKGSLMNFDLVTKINPNDTAAITYGGYAAQQLSAVYKDSAAIVDQTDTAKVNYYKARQSQMMENAYQHFNFLVEHKMADVHIHRQVIYYFRSIKNDTLAALNAVEQARKQFPDDPELKQDEITMMILSGKIELAKKQLTDAIEKDPGNHLYYYELGYIYDNANDYENSVKYYEKCLEINADYFEANFNLGVKHYNVGATISKEANFMTMDEYKKKGKEIEDKAAVYFQKSLPYFEKCHKLQPKDVGVLQTLTTIYGQLHIKDKADEAKKELDLLEGEKK
jgi:tetratricopeptide (TPR) repeat protein